MKYKIIIPAVLVVALGASAIFWLQSTSLSEKNRPEDVNVSLETPSIQVPVIEQATNAGDAEISRVSKNDLGDTPEAIDSTKNDLQALSVQEKVSELVSEYFLLSNKPLKKDDREEIIVSLANDPDTVEFFETVYSSGITEESELAGQQAEIRVLGVMVLEQVQKDGDEEPILRAIRGVNSRLLDQDKTKGINLDLRDLVSAWSSNRYERILQNPTDEIAKLGSQTGDLDELANGFLAGMTSHVPKETLWPFLRDHVISLYSANQNNT
ncbi:hypothetical protein [Gynuella sp.]|uniref:hypothetical protein n=1 Tax=Gynuella sp. TaxID=2969146 RepID=UPI003D0A557F